MATLIPVIDRLRQRKRFAIGQVRLVAERRMISAETIAGLVERGLDAEVREAVSRNLRACATAATLVGNSAYRRYLKTPDEKRFERRQAGGGRRPI